MTTVHTGVRPDVRVDLPKGGHIVFRPADTPGRAVARKAAVKALAAGEDEAAVGVAWAIALARWGAKSWEGVGDEKGRPLEITPDLVEALLTQDQGAFDAVEARYALPALELDREKNGFAPSPHGTSPDSSPTKPARARRGAAGTTAPRARTAAKSAPTS